MSVFIGDDGGIRIAPETTYGTAGTVFVAQHPITGTPAQTNPLLDPPTLGSANPTVRKYGVGSNDGEFVVAYDNSRAVIGAILAAAGNLVADDYTIGDGSAPDVASITSWVDFGGYAEQHTGRVLNSLRFEFQPDSPVTVTTSFLGQSVTQPTPVSITPPDEADIVWESDISAITIGGVAMCSLSGTIEVNFNVVGSDRHCLGAGVIKQPQRTGRATITVNLNTELSDDSGADSVAILAAYYAGTPLGEIVIGDFVLSNCYMTGDTPALGAGITQIPINAVAKELVITTVA